jgi:hypothetical protein
MPLSLSLSFISLWLIAIINAESSLSLQLESCLALLHAHEPYPALIDYLYSYLYYYLYYTDGVSRSGGGHGG